MNSEFDLNFSYAYGQPEFTATFRQSPEDFRVTEIFPEGVFSGDGEHLCFEVEKVNQNTHWVAKLLSEAYAVPEYAVGFCGLKDRRAVTRQWFSVHVPGTNVAKHPVLGDHIRIVNTVRHHKKLRRGDHQGNQFEIRLRNLRGSASDFAFLSACLSSRLLKIQQQGVPNYFGAQRFGREGNNLVEADNLLATINARQNSDNIRQNRRRKRQPSPKQGLYLSAARSYLFNRVLSGRIVRTGWEAIEPDATGPLWGRGRSPVSEQLRTVESAILEGCQDWLNGLEFSGLNQERRELVMKPGDFQSELQGEDLLLRFVLSPGQYATSLLRELVLLDTPASAPVI